MGAQTSKELDTFAPTVNFCTCSPPVPASQPVCNSCLRIASHAGRGVISKLYTAPFDFSGAAVDPATASSAHQSVEEFLVGKPVDNDNGVVPYRFVVARGVGDFSHVKVAVYYSEHIFGLLRGPRTLKANVDCLVTLEHVGGVHELKAQIPDTWGGNEFFGVVEISGTNGEMIPVTLVENRRGSLSSRTPSKLYNKIEKTKI
jgi:hypothetical protein